MKQKINKKAIFRHLSKNLSLVVIIFLVFASLLALVEPTFVQATGYSYYRTITVDHTKVGTGNQANFPVLVSGTFNGTSGTPDLRTTGNGGKVTDSNGYDIIFTSDSAGLTQLAHEIESYSPTTGAATFWVNAGTGASQVNGTTDAVIYIWYGNSSVSTSQQNISSTWDSSYRGVWHLNQLPAANLTDSTSAGNTLTAENMEAGDQAAGKIGGALTFDGSNEALSCTDAACGGTSKLDMGTSSWTTEAWVKVANTSSSPAIMAKADYFGGDQYRSLVPNTGFPQSLLYKDGRSVFTANAAADIQGSAWRHFVSVYNRAGNLTIYVDGAVSGTPVDISSESAQSINNAVKFTIGRLDSVGAELYLPGSVDEARVSATARSAAWITTQYNNQSAPATFYAFGSESSPPDITNPTVSTLSPADNATGVAATANLVITFDEAVNQETGNITIKKTSDNSTIETIDVTSGQVTGDGTTIITINPSVTLAKNTEYYVLVDATAFDDTSGNSYAGIASTTAWSFTTTTLPVVSTLSPLDNATGVSATANLVITFDEAVARQTGNITIKKTSDDSTVEAIDVTSGQVTGTGTAIITINPSVTLANSTGYYVLIDATAFDNLNGDSYAGIASTTAWSFTTSAEEVAPTVSTLSPADNATNSSTINSFVITFDEAVARQTGNITIKKTSDNSTVETIDVTSGQVTGTGTTTITINPTAALAKSTGYYVLIDTTAFDDLAGNSYAGISSSTGWNFSTIGDYDLLQSSDFTYLGAFRVPSNVTGSAEGFGYTGRGLAFNPAGNGGAGSLLMTGYALEHRVGEFTIPALSTNLAALSTATLLQNPTDITEGHIAEVGAGGATLGGRVEIGGLLVYNGGLIGTSYAYYDGPGDARLSHFTSELDFSVNGDFAGMYDVGVDPIYAGVVGGYMSPIPTEWQGVFGGPALTGLCCASILSRTSNGPNAHVFDPADLGVEDPVPITTILDYPAIHELETSVDGQANTLFTWATTVTGLVFPDGTASVLYIGTHGTGDFCYGTGTNNPALDHQRVDPDQPTPIYCYDPESNGQGTHAWPYQSQVWAYDANDLEQVKAGVVNPWDVQPYAIWELPSTIGMGNAGLGTEVIQGATFDPDTRRLYVTRTFAEELVPGQGSSARPLIEVYQLADLTSPDTTDPTVSSLSPLDNATGVSVTANLVITFDESVTQESGNIVIKKTSDDSTIETISVSSGQVTGDGTNTITINPSVTLANSTQYYITVASTAFDDLSGNSYAGISSTTAWSFTTVAEAVNPTVSTLSPADNATSVSTTANLVITFDEAVNQETGNITIKKTSDNSTIETIDVTSGQVTGDGTTTITINPSVTLATSTEYYVLVASTAFDDLAGNSYAGIASTTAWSFTTAAVVDSTDPTVSTLSPADNATSVSLTTNLVITFDEAVTQETGNITIKKTSDNSTIETIDVTSGLVTGDGTTIITINPSVTLTNSVEYYVLIDATAFDDLAGNSYAGIASTTAWSFTTLAASSGGNSSSSPTITRTGTTSATPTTGGTVSFAPSNSTSPIIRVDLSQGAVTSNTTITVSNTTLSEESISVQPIGGSVVATIGSPYEITATAGSSNITTFFAPVMLTFRYTDAQLPSGTLESNLVVIFFDTATQSWVELPTAHDSFNNVLTALTTHFTIFMVVVKNSLLPTSEIAHPSGSLVVDQGTVYLIKNGQRYPFRSEFEFTTHNYSFSQVLPATAGDQALPVSSITVKARVGTLVLDMQDKRTVYIIGPGGVKRGFVSMKVFKGLGYRLGPLPLLDLSDYTAGNPISDENLPHPDGTLVLGVSGTVWLIKNGMRQGFESQAVFESYEFTFANMLRINSAEVNLPEGPVIQPNDQELVNW